MAPGSSAELTSPSGGLRTDRAVAITFASFRLDLEGGRLLRGDKTVTLRPKTWAVLLHLAQHPGVLVTKDGLLDAVWPGIAVTPDVISKSIGELRVALGDDSRTPQFIETVQRRGFRFIATTRVATDEVPRTGRVFVGREEELRQLSARLAQAQAGERQIAFITGPAGIGKTALIDAFLASPTVTRAVPPVWIGRAGCIEHHGPREAYMPVLEALERLSQRSDAGRLLQLLRRTAPTWLVQMPWLLEEPDLAALREPLQAVRSARMLREFAVLLEALTRDVTLVLALEDLHWSDPSTVDLLSLLGQRRDPARLLLIGSYRPAEVAVREHPLGSAVRTLQTHRQCVQLPLLDLTEDAVRRYLEGRFPGGHVAPPLAPHIYAHTDGDPLFMVAIADDLVSRGCILDTAPGWALAAPVETMTLGVPDDVRLMIESQLERLSPAERQLLEAASAAGGDVTSPVVAAGLGCDEGEAERRCDALARTRRFLHVAGSVDWPDGNVVRRYAFIHELHRQVVHERMPERQRAQLHQSIGEALEAAYGPRALDIAPRLAVYFERSHDRPRAVRYLAAAGAQARERYANREAISCFQSALALVELLPDGNERHQQELDLRMALGRALSDIHGFTAEHVRENYVRADALCTALGNASRRFEVLYARWYFHALRAERDEATALAAELSALARDLGTPAHGVLADSVLLRTAVYDGRFAEARACMESLLAREHKPKDAPAPVAYGMEPVIAATLQYAVTLWFLGDPTQARATAADGLARAGESGNPFFQAGALVQNATVELLCRRPVQGASLAKRAATLSAEQGFVYWNALATAYSGWALVQQGHATKGSDEIEKALQLMHDAHAHLLSSLVLSFLAEGRWRSGAFAAGLEAVDEGLRLAQITLDRQFEPELWRLRGELLLAPSTDKRRRSRPSKRAGSVAASPDSAWSEAERSLLRALELSRAVQAKSLELRAATSLARAWRARGRFADAKTVLAGVCDWFGDVADNADLMEARGLLGELTSAQ